MSTLSRLFGSLRSRTALDREIDEEQQHHIELLAQELESEGMDAQEARRRAALRFGSRTEAREETRSQDMLPLLDDIGRNVRIAFRGLRHSPSYSLIVLLALALGIGANTAVYSVIHSVLFRPLPYPEPDRLAFIFTKLANGRRSWANYEDIKDWARDSKSFSSIAVWTSQTVNLTGTAEPDRLRGGFVSDNFFDTLGVSPSVGRSFTATELVSQGPRVAIASWGLWQEKFGGRPDFLNSKVLLNGEPYTIVGILPQRFEFPMDKIEVWLPYTTWPPYRPGRGDFNAAAVGRLAPAATLASAEQELAVKCRALGQAYPETNKDRVGAEVMELREFLAADIRPQLLVLGGAVFLALLVACANIGTLTVSRVLSRAHELQIRAALGAGRSKLVEHLFSEQLLLSLAGGVLGLVLAYWLMQAAVFSDLLPLVMAPRVDWSVACAALLFGIFTAVLTGLLPAVSLLRGKALDLSSGRRSSSQTRAAAQTRRLLVTASMAVSVMLLAGAGFMVKSFNTMAGINPGFDPGNLLTLEYRMPQTKYPEPAQQIEFHRRVAAEAAALPGVQSATVMMALPFSGNGTFAPFEVVGKPPDAKGSEPRAQQNRVDPNYFETMRIRLLRGRTFTPADRLGAQRVAVVSKSMAEHGWPGEDPLGRQVILLRDVAGAEPFTVVGVVADSKHNSLVEESADKAYVPFAQVPHIFGTLAVRTSGDPMSYATAVRQAVWKVDRDQPVWKVRSMESLVDGSVGDRRLLARVMTGFSAFAILLAMIGLYGVISYAVARRGKELGIRAAMGATRRVLVGMVVREGMRNIVAGLAVGLACAVPAARLLESQLYGTRITDIGPYVLAVLALVCAALLATVIPARRAAALDVATVLRQD